jgi:hypothetical protein
MDTHSKFSPCASAMLPTQRVPAMHSDTMVDLSSLG